MLPDWGFNEALAPFFLPAWVVADLGEVFATLLEPSCGVAASDASSVGKAFELPDFTAANFPTDLVAGVDFLAGVDFTAGVDFADFLVDEDFAIVAGFLSGGVALALLARSFLVFFPRMFRLGEVEGGRLMK